MEPSLTPTKQQHASTIDNASLSPLTPRKTPTRVRSKSTPSRRPTPLAPVLAAPVDDASEGILVAIRMRPLNKNESSHSRVWKALPKFTSVTQTTVEGKPLPERILHRNFFTFDKTFGEDSSTDMVYTSVAKNIVLSACTGLNGTIFAYGQTSSGKTYTMQGSGTIAEGSSGGGGGGIVHMAAQDVFSHIANTPDRSFTVRAAFLEIYNEEVRDLLSDSRTLQIREDPRRGVFVQAQEEIVTDFEALLAILFQGEKSRAFASTAMNERSSRSHTIFRITIESRLVDESMDGAMAAATAVDDGAMRVSTLNLVDLAGSESVRHTGATGDRQKEGGMINQSLLTLSRVMKSLGTPNQAHINFRDSKLTRILQPSLSGNARMAVICCITSSELYLEETRSTLQFAQRAKLVKTNAQVNEVLDDRTIIRRLQRELVEARRNESGPEVTEHIQSLERRAVLAETAASNAKQKLHQLYESSLQRNGIGPVERPFKRMRRLSEATKSTPSRSELRDNFAPATLPRAQSMVSRGMHDSSPVSSEADLLRHALTIKSENVLVVNQKVAQVSKQLEANKGELASSMTLNASLQADRDTLSDVAARQVAEIAQLKQQLEEVSRAHQDSMSDKDEQIQRLQASLDQQIAERKLVDDRVAVILQEKQDRALEVAELIDGKDNEMEDLHFELQIEQAFGEHFLINECNLQSAIRDHQQTLDDTRTLLLTLRDETDQERATKINETDVLSQQLESVRVEIREANNRADALSKEVAAVIDEKDSVVENRDTLQVELHEASAALNLLQRTHDDLVTRLESSEVENGILRTQLTDTSAKLSETMTIVEEGELTRDTLSSAIDELRQKLENAAAEIVDLSNQQESMREEATKLNSQLNESMSVSDNKDALLVVLKQDIESKQAEIVRLGNVMEQMASELAQIGADRDTALQRVCEMEADLVASSAKSDELRKANVELENALQRSEVESGDLRSHTLSLGDELTQQNATVREKELTIETMNGQNEELRLNLEQARAEIVDLSNEISVKRDETIQLSARLSESKQLLDSKESEYTSLKQEYESNHAELDRLCTLVESSTDELVQVVSDKVSTLHRLSGMESDLQAATVELDSLKRMNADLTIKLSSAETNSCEMENRLAEKSREIEEKCLCIAECNDNIQSLQILRDELKCTVEASKAESTALETKLSEVSAQLNYTETRLEATSSESDAARQDRVAIQSALDVALNEKLQLERAVSHASGESAANGCTILGLQEDVSGLESHVNLLKEEIGRLERKRVASEETASSNTQELKRVGTALETTAELLRAAESKCSALASELSEAHQLGKLKDVAVSDLNLQIQTYELIVKSLSADLEKGKAETSNSLDGLVATQTKLDGLLVVIGQALIQEEKLTGKFNDLRDNKSLLDAHVAQQEAALERVKDELAERVRECHQLEATNLIHANERVATRSEHEEAIKFLEARIVQLEEERRSCSLEQQELTRQTETERRLAEQLLDRIIDLERLSVGETGVLPEVALASNVGPCEKALSEKLSDALRKFDSVVGNRASIEAKVIDMSRELRDNRDEMLVMHDAVESANGQVSSLRQQVNDLTDELDSKDTILCTVEQERKQLLSSLEELRRELSHEDHDLNVASENAELKLLLASSNRSIEEARGQANHAEMQMEEMSQLLIESKNRIATLEKMNDTLSTKSIMRSSSHSLEELNAALNEKRELERLLQEERNTWQTVAAEMKRQMSDNERELIQDAEKSMRELRSDLASKEKLTKCLEAEAYEARRMNEMLEDECKRAQDRIAQHEKMAASLENENATLKRSSHRMDSEKDSEINSLKATLQQVKADKQSAQTALREVEKKLNAAIQARSSMEREVAAGNIDGLESENRRLATELDAVRLEAIELTNTIQTHEARIEKLKSNRLTRTQLAAIQQLKSDNAAFIDEVRKLKSDNEALVAKWNDRMKVGDSSKMESADSTKLRFDNEALEKKLRKVAVHCQSLEDDRVRILRVLQNAKCVADVDENDMEKAIVTICDALSSLKREHCSTMEIENRAALEVSKLKTQIASLNRQIVESRDAFNKALRSNEELRPQVASLQSKLQDHQGLAARTRELEMENVELHDDLKSAKQQVYGLKAEVTRHKADINLLRDELAMKIAKDSVPQQLPSSGSTPRDRRPPLPHEKTRRTDSKLTPRKESATKLTPLKNESSASKTTPNKENAHANDTVPPRHSGVPPHTLSASRATRQAARLGEAYAASEESTQQCQQS